MKSVLSKMLSIETYRRISDMKESLMINLEMSSIDFLERKMVFFQN